MHRVVCLEILASTHVRKRVDIYYSPAHSGTQCPEYMVIIRRQGSNGGTSVWIDWQVFNGNLVYLPLHHHLNHHHLLFLTPSPFQYKAPPSPRRMYKPRNPGRESISLWFVPRFQHQVLRNGVGDQGRLRSRRRHDDNTALRMHDGKYYNFKRKSSHSATGATPGGRFCFFVQLVSPPASI